MKTLKNTFAILSIVFLTFACSSNDDETPSQNQPAASDYFLKAKVDGVQFEAIAPRVLAGKTADRITISSVLPDLRSFEITIDFYPSNPIGTYIVPEPLSADYIANLKFSDGSSSSSIFAAATCCAVDCAAGGTRGTIVITAISAREISGTFSFTGTQTSGACPRAKKVVTEGSFKSGITQ